MVNGSLKVIIFSILLTTLFMLVEVIVGLLANSLALISDAGHMLSDSISLILALVAIILGKKKASLKNTFGLKRIEVVAALINGLSLILISAYIIFEAIRRLNSNSELDIDGPLVLITALIGLFINILVFILIHSKKDSSLNMKGVYFHIISDVLGSVAVIISALIISIWDLTWIDIVISIFISILIFKSGIPIVMQAGAILLEFSPKNINLEDLIDELNSIHGVLSIHDFHSWKISDNDIIMTAHILTDDSLANEETLLIATEIVRKYKFNHSTIQIDRAICYLDPLCVLPSIED